MTRECKFGHAVPKGRRKCLENHPLVVSFKCDVPHCTYVTEPVNLMKVAVGMFRHHMSEEHKQVYKCGMAINCHGNKGSDHAHCHLCFKVLHNNYMEKRHVKTQHLGEERHNCDHCEKSFASKTSLNYHTKKHHSDSGGIKCENCDEICPDFKSYNDHIDLHSRSFYDTDGHKCVDCGQIIHGKRNLYRHISNVHNLLPSSYQCDKCDFKTKRKCELKIHKEHKHSPGIEMVFPCNKCEKTFKYKKTRTRHEKIAHDNKSPQSSYQCDECDFKTKLKYHWEIHKKCDHPGIEMVFSCNKCERKFKYRKTRTRHEKIAHDNKSPQPLPASQKSTSEAFVADETLKQT
jgi:hypothetical protein